jgi:hypothetical protein
MKIILIAALVGVAYGASAVGVCLATQVSDNADKIERMTSIYASKPVLDKAMLDMKNNLDTQLKMMQSKYDAFKKALDTKMKKKAKKSDLPDTSKLNPGGAIYTRWGQYRCPKTSKVVYTGWVGGSYYQHRGSGHEYICMADVPVYGNHNNGNQNAALLYTSEMETGGYGLGNDFKSMHDREPACVVCMVDKRDKVLMVPGRFSCYKGWTQEYRGYLMAAHYSHNHTTSWICMDEKPQRHPLSNNGSQNGSLMYPTEQNGGCFGSHPGCSSCPNPRFPSSGPDSKGRASYNGGWQTCPRYVNNRELSCAVCTK